MHGDGIEQVISEKETSEWLDFSIELLWTLQIHQILRCICENKIQTISLTMSGGLSLAACMCM